MSMTTELIVEIKSCSNYMKEYFGHEDQITLVLDKAADTIQVLSEKLHNSQMERSSMYYNSGWIPVEDRLPEKGRQILCCNKYGSVFTSAVTYLEKYKDGNKYVCFGQHHDVRAWMPLPESYRAESEG